MASSTETGKFAPPDRTQLALALAIVKNKPPDCQVKDYIIRIRKSIRQSKDMDISCPEKFFDSVFFWKSAYEKSEAEQAKLLNSMYDLEQRNLSLLAKSNPMATKDNNALVSSNKRKQSGLGEKNDQFKSNAKRVRSNLAKSISRKGTGFKQCALEDSNDEKRTTSFIRQMCNLQRALQKRRNEKSLATNAVMMCKEAELSIYETIQQEIRINCQEATENRTASDPSPSVIFEGVEFAFRLSYRALHKFSKSGDESHEGKGQIIYYLVCLFESISVALSQYCTAVSKPKLELEKTHRASTLPKKPKAQKRVWTLTQPSNREERREEEIPQELTDLLCNMARSLDLGKEEDQKIMEGFLFIVLSRVGKMLALFVFNNLQLPLEACPKLKPPDGLSSMHQEGLSTDVGKCEATYLIKLLKSLILDEPSSLSSLSEKEAPFLRGLKNQFQNTLLQAVFGEDEPSFHQGLRRPNTPPPQDSNCDEIEESEFSEWFTHELWNLVGWEVLSNLSCH